MTGRVRWGILGTGNVAQQFADALGTLPDAELAAVGSRTQAAADAFGDRFAVSRRHATYEDLAADRDVDVVYIATPHALHKENSILCLEAGKAVLCEKPFTINGREAAEVFAVAQRNRVFVMEAMWTRFIPAVQQAVRWAHAGEIGDVRAVHASFGFRAEPARSPALFDPALGGGSLLDVGIYPITLAHMVFGSAPVRIQGGATLGRNGVDEQAGMLLEFENGAVAVLSSAITAEMPGDAHIIGTKGTITLEDRFWNASKVTIRPGNGPPESRTFPLMHNGYEYEAAEVQECLRAGKLQSDAMPHATTLEVLEIMDSLRSQWGLKYPME